MWVCCPSSTMVKDQLMHVKLPYQSNGLVFDVDFSDVPKIRSSVLDCFPLTFEQCVLLYFPCLSKYL